MRKKPILALSLLLSFVTIQVACNKKNDDNNTNNDADLETLNSMIALQDQAAANFSIWEPTMDSLTLLNELKAFFEADPSVSSATVGSEGVAVRYKSGLMGGIFIYPNDSPGDSTGFQAFAETNDSPLQDLESNLHTKSVINYKKAMFINPSYWERATYAYAIEQNYFSKVITYWPSNTSRYISYKDEAATLDKFCLLNNLGIIHVYTHGWAWPNNTNIHDVYVMTGEIANEATNLKYLEDINNGNVIVAPARVRTGVRNVYWFNRKFITDHNDFSKDTVLFYGGYCYSFLGDWSNLEKSFASGAYFGFDWKVLTHYNAHWSMSLLNQMTLRNINPPLTTKGWLSMPGAVRSYFNQRENRTVSIKYTGDASLTLWVPPKLTVTTDSVKDIFATRARSGGKIIKEGGYSVNSKGVCWSTHANPTVFDSKTNEGEGTEPFTSYMTGLTPSTEYFIRAYAIEFKDTAYGDVMRFTTADTLILPQGCQGITSVTDVRDGQVYSTVEIGNQCWLQKNMNYATGNSWCYDDDPQNCATYGRLYDWQTAMGSCPQGWHVPSDEEWMSLIDHLGGTMVAGGKMKETGTAHWITPNAGATNSSGFTALPGGYHDINGTFGHLKQKVYFWSSTELSDDQIIQISIGFDWEGITKTGFQKPYGFSVRCIRD